MNKKWIEEKDAHMLHFTPYFEELRIAKLYKDNGTWWFSNYLLDGKETCIGSQKFTSLENAKEYVEDLMAEHYEDKADHYMNLYSRFID